MRKTRVDTRELSNGPYYYVKWWDAGKERSKGFQRKAEADHFAKMQYYRLNSDVFVSPIPAKWLYMVQEYNHTFLVRGCTEGARYQAILSVNHFARLIHPRSSKDLTQFNLDRFVVDRQKTVGRWTVNKDIANLKAFVKWAVDNRYIGKGLKLKKLKVAQNYHPSLSIEQVRTLLRHCPSEIWRMRVLVSLVTGLRRDDVEALQLADVDTTSHVVRTCSRKTGKVDVKPLPDALMPALEAYLASPNTKCKVISSKLVLRADGRLFPDKNVRKEWDAIRLRAGFAEKIDGKITNFIVTRQDFRRTHATLMGLADGLQAAARALEHSSTAVTAQYYSDLSLIQRVRVNQLPVKEWLNWEAK